MVEQAIEALNNHGIFWFDGNTSYGDRLCREVRARGVKCYFEPVGSEFENVLYMQDQFNHDQVAAIAERRVVARNK